MNTDPFTPTVARDLHRSLIEWWQSRPAQDYANRRADFGAEQSASGHSRESYWDAVNPETERRRLTAAETFLVTDDMSAVCRHAAVTLPSLAAEHAMLPAEIGFILFNDHLGDHDPVLAEAVPLEAACWYPAEYDGEAGVAIATYLRPDTMVRFAVDHGERQPAQYASAISSFRAPLIPAIWTFLPYGAEPPEGATADVTSHYVIRMMLAAWLLMDQPLAQRERPRVPRSTERRAARAGLLSDLTVVMLRQPRGVTGDEPAAREYHCRWLVRGHWRRIPTPEQPSRVTWVHGYVKGPADAPLVVTDKVTVLAR